MSTDGPGTVRRRMATNQWTALGTTVSVAVTDSELLPDVRRTSDELLGALYTVLQTDLLHANHGAGSWIPVDQLLVRLLTAAVRVGKATSGLIPESDVWARTGIDAEGAIQVPPGCELDLSPLAKAFAVDLVVGAVPARTGASLIVSVGNHIAVGRPEGSEPHVWPIAVGERSVGEREAQQDRVTGGVTGQAAARRRALVRGGVDTAGLRELERTDNEIVNLGSGALATSSARTPRRRFRVTSDWQLLDPGKGSSLDPLWHTASVCAPACIDACGATLAAIHLGEQAPAWLWERDLPARLIAADGRILRLAGWPSR